MSFEQGAILRMYPPTMFFYEKHNCSQFVAKAIFKKRHVGRSINSDWFVNSFIMVVDEQKIFSRQLDSKF